MIGKTDEISWGIVEDPIHIHVLQATLLHLFGINHLKADLALLQEHPRHLGVSADAPERAIPAGG